MTSVIVLVPADNDGMHLQLPVKSTQGGTEKPPRGCKHFLIPLSAPDADCATLQQWYVFSL